MNREDIIRMAQEAGAELAELPRGDAWLFTEDEHLERFAAIVASAEREACVQIVENEAMQYAEPVWAFEIVNDIKARGKA